jgi:outer membrane murein-binding lipoprotein Lpp
MKDNHVAIILERMEGKFDAFAEAMSGIPADVEQLKNDVAIVKDDVQAIKAAVKDQSGQLSDHEERVTSLEAA